METVEGVVVVGGGAVGLLTALKLGKAGVRVVVLEARSDVTSSQHVVACTPPIIEALDRLGLLDDVRQRAVLCQDIAFRQGDGTLIAKLDWEVLSDATDHPHMLLLGQNHMSLTILEHLRRLPTVDIRWNHRVQEVEQNDSHVTLHASGPGGKASIRARWVVAADGAQSKVRETLGLAFVGHSWPERMVATNLYYDFSLQGYSRFNLVHDPVDWGFIAQLDKSGLWRLCYEEDPLISDAAVGQRLQQRLERLLPGTPTPDQYRVDDFTTYTVHQRCAEQLRRARVILAGDAACVTHAISGGGLSGGILEAEELAEALSAVLEDESCLESIDDYCVRRKRVYAELTCVDSSIPFTSMNERGPIQRARDRAMLKKAGGDRSLMRGLLLKFEQLNGRRSRSFTTRVNRVVRGSRWVMHHWLLSLGRSSRVSLSKWWASQAGRHSGQSK
ncbi:FAD-dependent oxidoreductase [Pseudomonas sp. NPDC087358]|uniref:FAD-dependent oxidoreductase n=1 Tax=Pseudomonas sp. NPDC087358 TaxID=3364439 RepID=UPI00384BB300